MADKQISVRIVATGGDKMQAQFKAAGAAGKKALNDIDRAAGQSRANLQNAAYQVQDVFVQVAAGTEPSRALAQQLPQLLGSMGLIGVLAGTAAAALIPLGAAFLGTGHDAEAAAKQIEVLQGHIDELNKINAVYSTDGIQKLIDKYGELNAQVLLLLERQRATKISEAMDAAQDAVGNVQGAFDDLRDTLAAYDSMAQAALSNPDYGPDAAMWAEQLQSEFGLTVDQARELLAAMEAVGNATSTEETANAVAKLRGMIEGSKLETTELKGALESAEDTLRQLAESAPAGGWMNAAIGGVQSLIGKIGEAITANNILARNNAVTRNGYTPDQVFRQQNDVYSGRGGDPRAFTDDSFTPSAEVIKATDALLNPKVGGGGGGGQSDALKEHNDLMREAEKVIESTRTAQEKYNDEVSKLDELLAANLINQETYDRALGDLKKELADVGEQIDLIKGGAESLGGAFKEWAFEGGNLLDVLGDKLTDLAAQMFEANLVASFQNILGSAMGSLGINLPGAAPATAPATVPLPSADGGGFTGNRPRRGGLDGRGGFMAMLHPQETVIDHTKPGRGAKGGGGVVVNIINNAGAQISQSESTGPNGERTLELIIEGKVKSMINGGRLDQEMAASYGAKRRGR
jgi:hypothetical protein